MREREERAGAVGVAADRGDHRRRGALLGARREPLTREAALEHQAVEVRVVEGERAVGRAEGGERVGCLEALGGLLEGLGDQRRLELALVAHVLVERGRADPEAIGHAAHREARGPFALEQLAGRRDDLAGARRADWGVVRTYHQRCVG